MVRRQWHRHTPPPPPHIIGLSGYQQRGKGPFVHSLPVLSCSSTLYILVHTSLSSQSSFPSSRTFTSTLHRPRPASLSRRSSAHSASSSQCSLRICRVLRSSSSCALTLLFTPHTHTPLIPVSFICPMPPLRLFIASTSLCNFLRSHRSLNFSKLLLLPRRRCLTR